MNVICSTIQLPWYSKCDECGDWFQKKKKKKKDNEVAVAYYELNISIIWETL